MKRKYGARPDWTRLVGRRFSWKPFEFGDISLLIADQVTAPLDTKYGDRTVRIMDNGYEWLQQFPAGENYTVTTMFDRAGKVVQWYIDITLRNGRSADLGPWMDDLYLDLVVLPDGGIYELDADELAAAPIPTEQKQLARLTCEALKQRIDAGTFSLFDHAFEHRKLLKQGNGAI